MNSERRLSIRVAVYIYIREIVAKITLENDSTKSLVRAALIISNNMKPEIS